MIHCGIIRQSAAIEEMDKECLRTGDNAICKFRFLLRAEYMHEGMTFIFREGNTKGIGRVVKLLYDEETEPPVGEAAARAEGKEKADAKEKPASAESGAVATSQTAGAARAALKQKAGSKVEKPQMAEKAAQKAATTATAAGKSL